MRILHVITALGVGGAENMLLKLLGAPALADVRQHVIALLPQGALAGAMRATGAQVEQLNLLGGLPLAGDTLRLAALARRVAPDVVHGWMYHGNLGALVARAAQRHRVPLVWGIRQSLASLDGENAWARAGIFASRLLSRVPDTILFNSRASLDQHCRFGFHAARMRWLPNGFDTGRFRPDAEARTSGRLRWAVKDTDIAIGLVARVHPVKDHEGFLRAAKRVADVRPNVVFVLCGTGTEPANEDLSRLISELGLPDRVRRLGETQDTPKVTAALDIAVSASVGEAFSNSIGEAMSCALPCVVTDVGDSALVVGDTGIVVPPRDSARLAQAMIELIDASAATRTEMGHRARARVESEFSLDTVAMRHLALWRELAGAD